jgi:hypothetical protein
LVNFSQTYISHGKFLRILVVSIALFFCFSCRCPDNTRGSMSTTAVSRGLVAMATRPQADTAAGQPTHLSLFMEG